jgi:hypothetical protein
VKIDQITEKRIIKELKKLQDESLYNSNEKVSNFAGGMYMGSLRILHVLGIKVKNWNDFE